MGIQRAGYQTVQSAGKIQKNVPLAHLELAVAAEGEQWLLAGGQITGRDASGLRSLHPGFSSFGSSSLFICLFIIFSPLCALRCISTALFKASPPPHRPPPLSFLSQRQQQQQQSALTWRETLDPPLSVGSYLQLEIGPETLHQCPSPSYLLLPTFIKTSAFISSRVIQA